MGEGAQEDDPGVDSDGALRSVCFFLEDIMWWTIEKQPNFLNCTCILVNACPMCCETDCMAYIGIIRKRLCSH
jgi:hypothetical protein